MDKTKLCQSGIGCCLKTANKLVELDKLDKLDKLYKLDELDELYKLDELSKLYFPLKSTLSKRKLGVLFDEN